MYRYDLLRPVRDPDACRHNPPRLGPDTLGIEITEPELAAACGLGNLDPQHGPGGDGRAAVKAALDHPLPPPGARLVTLRPDPDAFGAMAVLTLRAKGVVLGDEIRRRVERIARADRFDRGPWPGRRPLPTDVAELERLLFPDPEVAALAACCADGSLTPAARVAALERWLLGEAPEAVWCERVRARAERLWQALQEGRIALDEAAGGRIALLRSAEPGALVLGYLLAPVVVAEARAPDAPGHDPRKVTVAQWDAEHADLRAVAAELAGREPGWGGSATIVGSPQGRGTELPISEIAAVVARHLRS